MIKALFFDLDGTLLSSKREILPMTREALGLCREKGIKLFIATARAPFLERLLSWDADTLALFDGGVFYNGGCVVLDGTCRSTLLPADLVYSIVRFVCQCEGMQLTMDLENETRSFRYRFGAQDPDGNASQNPYSANAEGDDAAAALSPAQIAEMGIIKILLWHSNMKDTVSDVFLGAFADLCGDRAQLYLTDQERLIQIMAHAATKVNGIEKIRLALGLEKGEIAVFGDDIPDMEMLATYEHSVAMDNGDAQVKAAAKHVVPDNDSEGIHYALHNVFKLI